MELRNSFKLIDTGTGKYEIIHKPSRTWRVIESNSLEDALSKAESVINMLYQNGDPNFHPRCGDKFVVLKNDGITFTTGVHYKKPNGTGKVCANEGDIITFSECGDVNGWWDVGEHVYVKGSKPWVLIWNGHIKKLS